MNVVLLSPPYLPEYMRNARCDFVSLSASQWFPILLGYCGCWLEKKGHSVTIIDAPAYGMSHEEVKNRYIELKPDLLVVYTGSKSEENDIEFTDALLDTHRSTAVLTGPYFSITPEETLRKSKHDIYGVCGEFDHPVAELAEGKAVKDIKNLLWKKDGSIVKNDAREYLKRDDLDAFPFVSEFFARHLDFRFYRTPSEYHPFLDVMTGRGCIWGSCTYCLWVNTFVKGRVYNSRSIRNVIDELSFIERELSHVKSVMIQDDTLPADRARELAEEKMRKGIKLPWSCYVRGDVDYTTLRLMKESGCRNLHVGYESGSDVVLKRICKGLSKEQMTTFTADAKKAGLRIHGDFAIGFPGETEATVLETINWACKLRPHTAQFQLMIPFKGTPFYRELERGGWLKDGAPDYPHLGRERMEQLAKKAYRRFYISLPYLLQAIRYPREHLFNHIKTMRRAIPAMFWRRWNVR
ncbi:MAG: radical SAM protein [Candidatus Omnitrophota bacterium]